MQCQELHRDELAERYLNGQLDPAAQDEFEIHILECVQCLRQVEAVQTLRQELDERAHQIRAYSQVERYRFRWQWVTAAAFALVVCGWGVIEFQRMKASQSAKLQAPLPSPVSVKVGETIEVPATKSSSATSSLVDNLPVNGRNYVNFTLNDSQIAKDNAPVTGAVRRRGVNLGGQRARSNVVSVEGVDAADNSVSGIRTTESERTVSSSVASDHEISQVPPVTSDETTKELFRLGTITAFPYTFSGFGSSGKGVGSNPSPNALSDKTGGLRSSDPTRAVFRSAMDAYVEKRYADALEILEETIKKEPGAPDVNFYLGICRLLEAKPEASIAPLNAVVESKESPLQQAAHFYLAKAYIQTGDLASAESQLKTAAAMPGNLSTEAGLELGRLQALRSQDGKPSAIGTPGPQ